MPARIEILQWREAYDDEDCLSVGVFAEGDDTNFPRQECDKHGLTFVNDDPDVESGRLAPEDIERAFLITNEFTIRDGQDITHNGKTFRINIERMS